MKDLILLIPRYIGIMSKDNLDELKQYIRRFEIIEFLINKEISHSLFGTETYIVKSKLQ